MPDESQYDVFLSHSAKDKAVVRPLAERLRADGLRVWLYERKVASAEDAKRTTAEIQPLALSLQPLFRAPLNKERRFIPLRLDDAPIKGSLAQFLYLNWLNLSLSHWTN